MYVRTLFFVLIFIQLLLLSGFVNFLTLFSLRLTLLMTSLLHLLYCMMLVFFIVAVFFSGDLVYTYSVFE